MTKLLIKNEKHPVAVAVAPVKADAIVRAEQQAIKTVAWVTKELETAGWDLEKAAPYPNSGSMNRPTYMSVLSTHNLFVSITSPTKANVPYRRHNDPLFVEISPELVVNFIERAKENAAIQYDMFVLKLIGKIGNCETATLEGNHVWGYSVLTVIKKEGAVEHWKTQQIVNVSKLHKVFNQWPSRKMK